jgi:predicted nucleic acid-binding protein
MTSARTLLLVALAASAPVARASPQDDARLTRAIQLFNAFNDEEATTALRELLRHAPRASVAAKAHLYLGLIAFNTLDIDAAHHELEQAILLYPALELPANSSPKARIEFAEIQRRLASRGQGSASVLVLPPPPAARAAATAPAPEAWLSEETPSHPLPASFWWLGGSAVATGIAGTVFGVVASSTLAADKPVTAGVYTLHPISYGQWQTGQNEGLTADILWGVGGALLVSAVIVALTK